MGGTLRRRLSLAAERRRAAEQVRDQRLAEFAGRQEPA